MPDPMHIFNSLSRRGFLKTSAAAAAGLMAGCRISGAGPNVLLIYADDLGYGDLGCYGSTTIDTPNLDQLAAEGIRFTDYRSTSSVCSPSRASLLTGRYPSRSGMPFAVGGVYSDLGLQEAEVTLPELLADIGYRTACIGKWHLGIPSEFDYHTHAGFVSTSEFHPSRHGFDLFYGMVGNSNPDGSTALLEGDQFVDVDAHVSTITEHFTRRTQAFIRDKPGRPFFIYLAHTRAHAPWMPNPRFAGQSEGGVYGDMVEEIDWSTGELLRTLEQAGRASDTLVIFASDNGSSPSPEFGSNGPFRGGKGSTFEGGMRVPCVMRWPNRIPPAQVSDEMISALDILPTIAALTGARIPQDLTIDGADLVDTLQGQASFIPGSRIFLYYNGLNLQAVREGRWKLHLPRDPDMLVWWDSGPKELETPLLYDLELDPGETVDVADQRPDIVAQLLTEAERARAELGSWETPGAAQRPIEHLMDDRRRLRHLRTQQGHADLGRDVAASPPDR